jgi:hypothetical protein
MGCEYAMRLKFKQPCQRLAIKRKHVQVRKMHARF